MTMENEQSLSGLTFLITGATGRLGSDLTHRLECLGAKVLPLVFDGYPSRPKRTAWKANRTPVIVHHAEDLGQLPSPDYAIHLHWRTDRSLTFSDQLFNELDYAVNRILPFLEWLKKTGCRKIVNISSIKVFSHLNGESVNTETEPRPMTPYGIAKLTTEKFLDAFFQDAGPDVVHFRLGTVASAGEHPAQLMTRLYESCFSNTPIQVNAAHSIGLMYIDEAVDLMIRCALASNGRLYHVTGPFVKVGDVAAVFEKVAEKPLNADYVVSNDRPKDPAVASNAEELTAAWVRRTPLESMARCIIDHYNNKCLA